MTQIPRPERPSLGDKAGELGVGALFTAAMFRSPDRAKAAWEAVAKRTRLVSVYRYVPDPDHMREHAVICLAEDDEHGRREVAKAERILLSRRGLLIAPNENQLAVFRGQRASHMMAADAGDSGTKRITRVPTGYVADADGRRGPILTTRPQG